MADFIDNSGTVLSELDAAIERALEKCGLTAEAYAKLLCRVDTGRLRGSITYATRIKHSDGTPWKDGTPSPPEDYELHGTPDKYEVVIGTNVEYAASVELGDGKRRAHPFLRPAVENHRDEYNQIIQNELRGG